MQKERRRSRIESADAKGCPIQPERTARVGSAPKPHQSASRPRAYFATFPRQSRRHHAVKKIIAITSANPMISIAEKEMWSHRIEASVATTGSIVPSRIARKGPMSCTPCR